MVNHLQLMMSFTHTILLRNKDYTGVRYDRDFQNIVGAKEYHDGKAKDNFWY